MKDYGRYNCLCLLYFITLDTTGGSLGRIELRDSGHRHLLYIVSLGGKQAGIREWLTAVNAEGRVAVLKETVEDTQCRKFTPTHMRYRTRVQWME